MQGSKEDFELSQANAMLICNLPLAIWATLENPYRT
jgi:hypothetical protein